MISNSDREILRELAKKQLDMAHSKKMESLRRDWQKHGNRAADSRPMVTMELWTFAEDIIPPLMRCEGEEARLIEWNLHSNMVNHSLFDDDTLVRDYISVSYGGWFKPFDIEPEMVHTDGLGYHFVSQITDLEEDFHKLKPSAFGLDRDAIKPYVEQMGDLFYDILPVKLVGSAAYICVTYDIVRLMSLEDMFIAMSTEPELFKQMIGMLTDDYIRYIELLEREGAFLPTVDEVPLAQGSYCFDNRLPREGEALSAKQIWCHMNSQESTGISPEMFGELIAPYYKRISDRFGLLSYGCCEAVDPMWDSLSTFENMGKVSISPWCNEEYMGEQLCGTDIVYLRKPTPNLIGVGDYLDEAAVSEHMARTVRAAKGSTLEISQRDVYYVSRSPEKVRRYVELIRRECANHQK